MVWTSTGVSKYFPCYQCLRTFQLTSISTTEYPGEPDIPGLPAGGPNDASNYLGFLKLVRSLLPSGKTLSIAAPASFWYLKQFPIKEISEVVDYIIYMTYDLHGQWDAENKFSKYEALLL